MPTYKIADLPKQCRHPNHNPPQHQVFEDGVWQHVCPGCGKSQTFTVSKPTWTAKINQFSSGVTVDDWYRNLEDHAWLPPRPIGRWRHQY